MDLSIWDLPYCQAEDSYPAYSLADDIHFTQKLEEDASNEKYCVHVLKILNVKADKEIAELEDDVVMLQSQLACADEKWSEMCFATLNKKIAHLDILIAALKSETVQGSGVHLETNKGTSERIHEILKRLLRSLCPTGDKQPADSSLGGSKLAAAGLPKVGATDHYISEDTETGEHTIAKDSSAQAFGYSSNNSTVNDHNELDIPGKVINASRTHLNNSVCAVVKNTETEHLRGEANSCGTANMKSNISEDICGGEPREQSSKDKRIIINSSPEIKETRNRGPKPAGAIVGTAGATLETRLIAVTREPKESRDEQTQIGVKAGQTRETHTSSRLVRKNQNGAKSLLGMKGQGVRSETGHTLENSIQGLLNPKKKDRSKPVEKLKGEVQEKQPPQSQALILHRSNSKLSVKLDQRLTIKWNLPPEMCKELCLAEELGLRSRPGLKLKRQWKTEMTENSGGDEFGDRIIKESSSLLGAAKGAGNLSEISSTSLNHLKKRRITNFRGLVLQENENLIDFQNRLVKPHDRSTIISTRSHDGSNQYPQVIKVKSDELLALEYTRVTKAECGALLALECPRLVKSESSKLLASRASIVPTTTIDDLAYMTVDQLKAVARQENVRGIYKLRKAELQELLRFKLLSTGRST